MSVKIIRGRTRRDPEVIDLIQFKESMYSLERCCLTHPQDFDVENIEFVEAWDDGENDGPTGHALFRMKNGSWATMYNSRDYTGHGCQCSSGMDVYSTREEAIRLGLDDEGRKQLGLALETKPSGDDIFDSHI